MYDCGWVAAPCYVHQQCDTLDLGNVDTEGKGVSALQCVILGFGQSFGHTFAACCQQCLQALMQATTSTHCDTHQAAASKPQIFDKTITESFSCEQHQVP